MAVEDFKNKRRSWKNIAKTETRWGGMGGEKLSNPTRKPELEPTNVTRPYLLFPATISAELGTNLKLRSRPSFPCHPRRRKTTGTPAIKAWKPTTVSLCSAGIFAGFGWHHQLAFVPHDSLFHFRPSTAAGDIVLPLIGRWKTYSFGSSIRRHRRAWEVTTATVGLSVARTFRLKLPVQRWLNSGDHWPIRDQ